MNKINEPFKFYCQKVIPLAFDESLSYYEVLCGLVNYIKTEVIDKVNASIEATAELQEYYIMLKSYVDNYFTDLNIQKEINEKLDIMVEDGTLEKIINENIFNSLNEKIDERLLIFDDLQISKSYDFKIGDVFKTYGFHVLGDGGSANYIITDDTTFNNMDKIELNNGMCANLIENGIMNIMCYGTLGNGIADDTNIINYILDKARDNNYKVTSPKDKTYLITSSLNVSNLFLDLNKSKFITNTNIDIFVINTTQYYGEIKNVTIDSNFIANSGINIINGRKCYIEKIDIVNVVNTGIIYNDGYEVMIRDINIQGSETHTTSFGFKCYTGDSYIENVVMIDCCTGILNVDGFNYYNNVHAWIWRKPLIPNSAFIKCSGGKLVLNNCYADTYQYAIYQFDYIPTLIINNFANVYNTGIYLPEIARVNQPIFMYCEQDSGNALTRLSNSFMNGYSEDINTKLTNLSEFGGDIVNSIFRYFDKNLSYTLLDQSNLSENVSIRESDIQKVSKMVTINNIIDITNISDNKQFNVGSIPYYFRPFKEYIGAAYYSSGKYGVTGLCYVYIGTNGSISVTLPDSVSGVVNIKLNLTFITHKEY